MKDDAEEDPPASSVITSNSKVTVFNANIVLATLVSITQMVYFGEHTHTKYIVPGKTRQILLT